ncbi:MAG: hypothetical protein HN348_31145, partial [Proteobacteria bacterium]|nr:hypothetical protein [Pseudomonadota bacterium]
YASFVFWAGKLEAAEAIRPDLVDGTGSYRHFLFGKGAKRDVNYERFIDNDSSGAKVLKSASEDARSGALEQHDLILAANPQYFSQCQKTNFSLRTQPVGVGSDDRYPYPATENWQKAIGAHIIWMEMDVKAEVFESDEQDLALLLGGPQVCTAEGATEIKYQRRLEISLTVHMEDRYNFNPGGADMATGAPDSANGRFELTGLGNEFLNYGKVTRKFDFTTNLMPGSSVDHTTDDIKLGEGPNTGRPVGSRGNPAAR